MALASDVVQGAGAQPSGERCAVSQRSVQSPPADEQVTEADAAVQKAG